MPSLRSRLPVELGSVGDPKAQVGRLHRLAVAGGPGWGLVRLLRKGKGLAVGIACEGKIKGQYGGCNFNCPVSNFIPGTHCAPGSVVCIRGLGLNITFWLIVN